MLIARKSLKKLLELVLDQRISQGCDLPRQHWQARIEQAACSYDAMYEIARALRHPASRSDWPYWEPLNWGEIVDASPGHRDKSDGNSVDSLSVTRRIETAFLGSVCGCMLGKPIEVNPTLAELKRAGTACGQWPIQDYISRAFLAELGRQHDSADWTMRESITAAVADDDIHYTLIGMLALEKFGLEFTAEQLFGLWATNIPPEWTWGAERTQLLALGMERHHFFGGELFDDYHDPHMLNPGDESCGALIRADAYGYACPGDPALASWLAFKDASLTHTRTGVYGAMFIAALIALSLQAQPCHPGNGRLELVEQACSYIPGESRLAEVILDATARVAKAGDWESAYHDIHGRYREFTHCQVYQEIGTLANTLKFTERIDHGICIQVAQGNDTDSFGATAGSVLGGLFGPGYIEERWLQPFDNRLEHGLSDFHVRDLGELARRMGCLPAEIHP